MVYLCFVGVTFCCYFFLAKLGEMIYIYIMIQFDDMIFFNLAGGPTCPRKVKAFERSSF